MKLKEFFFEQISLLLPETLTELPDAVRQSIARHGVLVPPVVCNGILCDGHRRLIACKEVGKTSILCLETAGVAGLLFAELNSHRELSACEAAAVFKKLTPADQSAFLSQAGLSESPQMRLALDFIAEKILTSPELLSHSMPVNVWRELAHLGDAINRFARPLLTLSGTAAEKRNIAALLRQAQRRNELPEVLPGNTAAEVIAGMQKIAQPRRSTALEKFQLELARADLPAGAALKIDPTFSQPGIHISLQITRNHIERIDQTRKAVESIFAAVPEL
ncbi:MAG: ParB/Srx family N-terminal domain-containing protein [Candidatus Riflebacteria bacterium]|nr:ParB/Srx family N-terminal domain-containing protein [Candidatus Riflebacteria bacterium]